MLKIAKPWLGASALVLLGAAGLLGLRGDASSSASAAQLRTATVTRGTFTLTLRLSGTTAAERFAALIAPRLRGTRAPSSSATGTTVAASTSGSSTAAAPVAGAAAQLGTGAASAGGAINASAAFRAATSRVGSSTTSSSSSATSSSTAAATSAALGASGLGSTGDQLRSNGGGDHSSDFTLVLRDVVAPGTAVKKGQQVAEFDRQYMLMRLDDFKDAVTQSAASLKSQQADIAAQRKAHDQLVSSAKADVDKAQLDMKTIPVLSRIDGERTKMALEQAQARYKQLVVETKFVNESNDALLRESELSLAESKLELAQAQRNTDRMLVKAPVDGLVVMESAFRGGQQQQIQKGDQLFPGMRYMRIVDPSQMMVNASVNQTDVRLLHIGQKATVRLDAYPGLVLDAHIESIPPATKPGGFRAKFVRTVPVRVRLDQTDMRVMPDLSVSVDVMLDEAPDAVMVNRAAIFGGGPGAIPGEAYVYVRRGSGWRRQRVDLGSENNIDAVVTSGIQPGDVVALEMPPESGNHSAGGSS